MNRIGKSMQSIRHTFIVDDDYAFECLQKKI